MFLLLSRYRQYLIVKYLHRRHWS